MTAALILTSSSHTIACASCNAPWPLAVAQCPGCGRREEAPVAEVSRFLCARCDAPWWPGVERCAECDRRAANTPEAQLVALRAQLAAVTAERDALHAIVEGRAEPPTTEEIAAASKPNSFWLCEHNGFAWLVRFVADDGVWIEVDGEPWEPVAPRLARLSPGRWWFLLNGAPAAWPTVPA